MLPGLRGGRSGASAWPRATPASHRPSPDADGRKQELDRAIHRVEVAHRLGGRGTVCRVLSGQLGNSIQRGVPVIDAIAANLPSTLRLTVLGFVTAASLALVIAFLATLTPFAFLRSLLRGLPSLFISLPVFYSPQWIVWLLPFLVPLTRQQRPLVGLIVALDLITFVRFPLANYHLPDAVIIYGRYAILAALVAVLARAEWRRPPAPVAVGVV